MAAGLRNGTRPLLSATIIGMAIFLLYRALQHIDLREAQQAIRNFRPILLWACAALTVVSLSVLGTYEVIASRLVVPGRLAPVRAWLAGIAANAISSTLGFHAITATAVRYRLYAPAGLRKFEIAQITALTWSALAFGFSALFCLAALAAPAAGAGERTAGLILIAFLPACAWWLGRGRQFSLGGFCMSLPSGRIAGLQMVLGAVEMAAAVGGLYILLPAGLTHSFADFSLLYIGAVLLGIASHAPGGIGVFEATILTLSPAELRVQTLAALLLYRLIYNLLPFLIAGTAMAANEVVQFERG